MGKQNHLANESSLYLRQHADNPVDWYPWNDAALQHAREQGKPILLSIGYSACHWCHVMARESFMDMDTANIMNEKFINIKVDREERPDLDKIFQLSHQILTGRAGGWPLTIFLDSNNLIPFFSGTYFPKQAQFNLPSFQQVLHSVSEYYQQQQQALHDQQQQLQQLLTNIMQPAKQQSILTLAQIKQATLALKQDFDAQFAGFGDAPKFPNTPSLQRLLDFIITAKSDDNDKPAALHMLHNSLQHMAEGGIHDQLGGGFFRYTVDAMWMIPHFEKMLYDNGLLLALYTQAQQTVAEPWLLATIKQTADWLLNSMQDKRGGFYASLNADSEGIEGKYYVWQKADIQKLLNEEEFDCLVLHYGLDKHSNFDSAYHFYISEPLERIAEQSKHDLNNVSQLITQAKQKLLAARQQRVMPSCDQKIIVAWNALAIKGLALAGSYCQQPQYTAAAFKALDFIKQHLYINKQLFSIYNAGRASIPAFLDDYAFLLDAVLILLESDWRSSDLHFAIDLAENLVQQFYDNDHGGFYFTAKQQSQVLFRPKSYQDESLPAGNAVAIDAFLRLGSLLAEPRYLSIAETSLANASEAIKASPNAHMSMLSANAAFLEQYQTIIIVGSHAELKQYATQTKKHYHPTRQIYWIANNEKNLPPVLLDKLSTQDKLTAYSCQGLSCNKVVTDATMIKHLISDI